MLSGKVLVEEVVAHPVHSVAEDLHDSFRVVVVQHVLGDQLRVFLVQSSLQCQVVVQVELILLLSQALSHVSQAQLLGGAVALKRFFQQGSLVLGVVSQKVEVVHMGLQHVMD